MPQPSPGYFDELLLSKTKRMIQLAIEKTKHKNDGMTFERFVKDWDIHDSRSRHMFSAIVVDTAVRKPLVLPKATTTPATASSNMESNSRSSRRRALPAEDETSFFHARVTRPTRDTLNHEWSARRGLMEPPFTIFTVAELIRALNETETDDRRRAFPLSADTWLGYRTSSRLQDAHVSMARGTSNSAPSSSRSRAGLESFSDFTARRRRENRSTDSNSLHYTPLPVIASSRLGSRRGAQSDSAASSTADAASTSATTPADTGSCPRSPSPLTPVSDAAAVSSAATCPPALTSAQIAERAFQQRNRPVSAMPQRSAFLALSRANNNNAASSNAPAAPSAVPARIIDSSDDGSTSDEYYQDYYAEEDDDDLDGGRDVIDEVEWSRYASQMTPTMELEDDADAMLDDDQGMNLRFAHGSIPFDSRMGARALEALFGHARETTGEGAPEQGGERAANDRSSMQDGPNAAFLW